MRRRIGIVLFAAIAIVGCDVSAYNGKTIEPKAKPAATKTEEKTTAAPAVPLPANVAPQPAAVLATVNGKPVYMAELHAALVEDYGMGIAQQQIADEVVRQELVKEKIPVEVTDEEVAAESNKTLQLIFRFPGKPSEAQFEALLNQFLAKNRYTRRQWDVTIARNVRLNRLAARKVKITDKNLRDAFMHQYDGKLRARHIQVPSLSEAQEVLKELKTGKKFEALAKKYSTNPSYAADGFLPDIGMRSAPKTLPPAIIQTVRSLKKPGQTSNPIQVGTNFHIIQLAEIIQPEDVKFEEVKEKLKPIVRENMIRQSQQAILRELIKAAKIEYVNPTIRKQSKRGK